jgi:nitroreductase
MTDTAECFNTIVHTRRAVRKFDPTDYDPQAVTRSLERAHLAPSSSNMQLWEFYRVSSPDKMKLLSRFCMGQNTTETAREMIVVVARPDLWRRRAQSNYNFVKENLGDRPAFKGRSALSYYGKLMPMLYNNDMFGIRGTIKKIVAWFIGLRRPMVRQVSGNDMRIVAHKSAALAAQMLFAWMRQCDDAGAVEIWVENPPPGPDWDGVRDRLQRAAAAAQASPIGLSQHR